MTKDYPSYDYRHEMEAFRLKKTMRVNSELTQSEVYGDLFVYKSMFLCVSLDFRYSLSNCSMGAFSFKFFYFQCGITGLSTLTGTLLVARKDLNILGMFYIKIWVLMAIEFIFEIKF